MKNDHGMYSNWKSRVTVQVVHNISHHFARDDSFTVEGRTCDRFSSLLLTVFVLLHLSSLYCWLFRPRIATLFNWKFARVCVAVHNCLNCAWSSKLHGNATGPGSHPEKEIFDKSETDWPSRFPNNPAHLLVDQDVLQKQKQEAIQSYWTANKQCRKKRKRKSKNEEKRKENKQTKHKNKRKKPYTHKGMHTDLSQCPFNAYRKTEF